jgi:hypothetical protein
MAPGLGIGLPQWVVQIIVENASRPNSWMGEEDSKEQASSMGAAEARSTAELYLGLRGDLQVRL